MLNWILHSCFFAKKTHFCILTQKYFTEFYPSICRDITWLYFEREISFCLQLFPDIVLLSLFFVSHLSDFSASADLLCNVRFGMIAQLEKLGKMKWLYVVPYKKRVDILLIKQKFTFTVQIYGPTRTCSW